MNSTYYFGFASYDKNLSTVEDVNAVIKGRKLLESMIFAKKLDDVPYPSIFVKPKFRRYSIQELLDLIYLYENKYRLSSQQFYKLYKDNNFRTTNDFVEWAMLYRRVFLTKNATI